MSIIQQIWNIVQNLWAVYWDTISPIISFLRDDLSLLFVISVLTSMIVFSVYTGYDHYFMGGYSASLLRRTDFSLSAFLFMVPQMLVTFVAIVEQLKRTSREVFKYIVKEFLVPAVIELFKFFLVMGCGVVFGAILERFGIWEYMSNYVTLKIIGNLFVFSWLSVFLFPVIRLAFGTPNWKYYCAIFFASAVVAFCSAVLAQMDAPATIQEEVEQAQTTTIIILSPFVQTLTQILIIILTFILFLGCMAVFIAIGRKIAKTSLEYRLLTQVNSITTSQPVAQLKEWQVDFPRRYQASNQYSFLSRFISPNVSVSIEPSNYFYNFVQFENITCFLLESYGDEKLFYIQKCEDDRGIGHVFSLNSSLIQTFSTSMVTDVEAKFD